MPTRSSSTSTASSIRSSRPAAPAASLAGYAGSKVLDEYSVQVSFETPYRAVPHLRGVRPAQPRLPQGGARERRPGPHAARRHRAVHDQGVRRQGPHDDGPQPRLHAEGAVERSGRPRAARRRRLEVHPRGGHARDHARERRDAGHVHRPGPVAAPPRERTRRCGSRRRRGRACRASGCSTSPSRRWTTCGCAAPSTTRSTRTRSWPPSTRARRSKANAPLTAVMLDDPALKQQAYPVRCGQGQGPARRGRLAAGRRRDPDQGRPAPRDRAERHRVRRRSRSDGAAHPGLAAGGRDRRQDQGPGAAAVVRGQLPLRHPRAGHVPALHRSRRPVLAVPLARWWAATSTGRA